MPIINEFIFAQVGVSANYEMYGQEFILEVANPITELYLLRNSEPPLQCIWPLKNTY